MFHPLQQLLERELDLSLSMQEIRSLNMSKIKELQGGAAVDSVPTPAPAAGKSEKAPKQQEEATAEVPKVPLKKQLVASERLVKMNSIKTSTEPVFILHSIEGDVDNLTQLAGKLNRTALGVQRTKEVKLESIEHIAVTYMPVSIWNSSRRHL